MIGDATYDDGTNGPEHLQHLSGRSSQLDGCDLAAVCWGIGDEDAPWDTLEELCHEHDRKRVGEVENKDEAVQEHEAGYGRPTVSDSAGKGASQEDTDDCTKRPSHLERRLPAGRDDHLLLLGAVYTVVVREPR